MTIAAITDHLTKLFDPASDESKRLVAGLADETEELRSLLLPRRRAESLAELIRTVNLLPPDPGLMLQHGDGGSSFSSVEGARFLLRRVDRGKTSSQAMEELQKLLAMTSARGRYVLSIWGISIDESTQVSDGVSLERWIDLPDSSQKQWISDAVSSDSRNPLVPSFFLWVPRVAVTIRHEVSPLFRLNGAPMPIPPRLLSDRADEARLALTAIGPSAPLPAAAWFQFDDDLLQDATSYGGVFSHHIEIVPFFQGRETLVSAEDARKVVGDYLASPDAAKRRLSLSLQRLNNACRRRLWGDQALELAIALELLLVDSPGEHTFKVALRAANLWNGSLEARKRVRAVMEGVYKLRSAVVHSATAPAEVKLRGYGAEPTDSVLAEALSATATLHRIVLNDRALPDWATRDLL